MRLAKELTEKERKQRAAKAALCEAKDTFLIFAYVGIFFAAAIFLVWFLMFIVSIFGTVIGLIIDVILMFLATFIWIFVSAYRRNLK